MKRWVTWIVSLTLATMILGVPALSNAQQVRLRVGDPYNGSELTFSTAPRMTLIPDTRVYAIQNQPDANLYRYGNTWYYVEDGAWYRASSWRGPFLYVRTSMVPQIILSLPSEYQTTWYSSSYRNVDRRYPVRIETRPGMAIIPDTRVYYSTEDTDYDLYRYGNTWYLVDNGRWYRAYSWRGPFYYTSRWDVPRAVRTIPADYRRNWATNTSTSYGTGYRRTIRVGQRYTGTTLETRPSMTPYPGTRVFYLRDQSDYDLYQYGGSWYLEDNGVWYRASSWRGPFFSIDQADVPSSVLDIWENNEPY
jgi:hypothetical protein